MHIDGEWQSVAVNSGMVGVEKMIIDDAYLYKHMPAAEMILMSRIPPEEELCHVFSRRFCRKMKAMIKYERRTPRERAVYRGLKVAFATLAVILLVVFGSAMSVQAYRHRFVEFIVEVFEELTSYSVQEKAPTGETADLVEPSYVPDGYEVNDRIKDNRGSFVVYENGNGDRIHYRQESSSLSTYVFDTETSVVSEVYVGKQKFNVVEEADTWMVHWTDNIYIYYVIGAKSLSKEELLKMARSIIE